MYIPVHILHYDVRVDDVLVAMFEYGYQAFRVDPHVPRLILVPVGRMDVDEVSLERDLLFK